MRKRLKILSALSKRPHRYDLRRVASIVVTLAVLWAVPLSGLARVDAWGGHHVAFARPVGAIYGTGVVALAVLGFYLITFVLNSIFGRLFCGWGCPVSEAARLGERAQVAKGARRQIGAHALAIGYAATFSAAVLAWWVSPRVLWAGSARARVTALAVWAGLAAAVWLHGRFWRWGFCMRLCPIGLYYSAVQTTHGFRIHFDRDRCTDCGACVDVCPVELDPKDLAAPKSGIGGVAIDGMPGDHHCLTCGDCVEACELVLRRSAHGPALRLGRAHTPSTAANKAA